MTQPANEASGLIPWYKREITPDMARRYGKQFRLSSLVFFALTVGLLLLDWKIATTLAACLVLITLLESARLFAWATGVEVGRRRERKALGLDQEGVA